MFYVTCVTVFILKIETVTVIGPLTGEVEWSAGGFNCDARFTVRIMLDWFCFMW